MGWIGSAMSNTCRALRCFADRMRAAVARNQTAEPANAGRFTVHVGNAETAGSRSARGRSDVRQIADVHRDLSEAVEQKQVARDAARKSLDRWLGAMANDVGSVANGGRK